ncbi:hypothetical protein BDF14DRAFT_265956 [Spinellus fusiger]|nr:hypothetical protein BDF14DRAFT_265956 [Spinellus fusiger]
MYTISPDKVESIAKVKISLLSRKYSDSKCLDGDCTLYVDSIDTLNNYIDGNTLYISIKVMESDGDVYQVRPSPSENASFQFDNEKISRFHDVTIRAFENENEDTLNDQVLHSSKLLLATASTFFEEIFTIGMKESTRNEIILRGVNLKVFNRILQYIYTGRIDI